MIAPHYEFVPGDEIPIAPGRALKRIRLLVALPLFSLSPGALGGYVEDFKNLSGDAWVSGNARVYGNAQVYGDAWVSGNAQVYGDARVYGNAQVYGDARVSGNARVYGNARVSGNARVYGNAQVYGDAWVYGDAQVYGNAWVYGNARVYGNAWVSGGVYRGGDFHICLGHADGYGKGLSAVNGVAWIGAGCRWFTLADALRHWGGNPDRKLTMCLMQAAIAVAAERGLRHE